MIKHWKRAMAAVMCAAVLMTAAPVTAYADSTLDHLNGQYSELEKQQQAIKDKLNKTKTEKEKQEAIRKNLTNQISTTQKQINLLDNKINYLQNDIADKEQRINELSAEVVQQQDLFMKRIRSIYKTSVGTSMLGMVFGVDSLGSYLSYGKYLSRISEHDSALLQTLSDNIEELRTLQAQMQAEKPGAALLYGVTGSGKTSVYLALIRSALDAGRSAMLLVPEIALTPQLLHKMTAHFGKTVAVLHSSLRVGERYDEWRRIARGEARVVVGTRSAVFAPLQNPGLLILDEEQEHTYKSENAPRYHAREIALYRSARAGALVLFGSATPSIETMYLAKTGVYSLYTLKTRYNGRALPDARIIDMKQELRVGNDLDLSRELEEGIRDAILDGKQSILFLNRRGNSRYLVCMDCGDVPQCPRCSVHLTYHSSGRRLMCHYCGYSRPAHARCENCGGAMKAIGSGTQKVEQELKALFPDTAVLRMDADTVAASGGHEAMLRRFRDEQIPILLGTQMVAKGLDFPSVTLVGVLDADMSLYVDNFRAAETTFSLITQVVGRSGRGADSGCAMIQTMTPEHPVLQLAARQDYDAFYDMELQMRKLRSCPPFSDLFTITVAGLEERGLIQASVRLRDALAANLQREPYCREPAQLLGPAPAPVARVNYSYRYQLTLVCRNTAPIRRLLAFVLAEFSKDRQNRGLTALIDINSYN